MSPWICTKSEKHMGRCIRHSPYVDRVDRLFPSDGIERACEEVGVDIAVLPAWNHAAHDSRLAIRTSTAGTLQSQARAHLDDLFPSAPPSAKAHVVSSSFGSSVRFPSERQQDSPACTNRSRLEPLERQRMFLSPSELSSRCAPTYTIDKPTTSGS